MNQIYISVGISKQAFHQKMDRNCIEEQEKGNILQIIYQIRADDPTMGCRDMYFKIQPETMGRDVFERFYKSEELMVESIKNWRRTTDSSGVIRFANRIESHAITRINQVWQSDITYFELNSKFYYITFIIDACSRRIVGHSTSRRLLTEQTTLQALEMAIKLREKDVLTSLIFHSYGGGQYYAKELLISIGKSEIASKANQTTDELVRSTMRAYSKKLTEMYYIQK